MACTNGHDAFFIEPMESRTLLFSDTGIAAAPEPPLALTGMIVHAMKIDHAVAAAPPRADVFSGLVFTATAQAFAVDGRQLITTVFGMAFTFPVAEMLGRPVEGFGDGAARGAPRVGHVHVRDAVAPPAKSVDVPPAAAAVRGSGATPDTVRAERQAAGDSSAARATSGATSEMIVSRVTDRSGAGRAARSTALPAAAPAPANASAAVRGNWAGRAVTLYLSQLADAAQASPQLAADAQAQARVAAAAAEAAQRPAPGMRVDAAADQATPLSHALPERYRILPLGSPFTLLADSIGAFVEEAARISSLPASGPHRAWLVTLTVLAADAAILSYYYYRKRHDARLVRVRSRSFIP